jgi:hypothetical protein
MKKIIIVIIIILGAVAISIAITQFVMSLMWDKSCCEIGVQNKKPYPITIKTFSLRDTILYVHSTKVMPNLNLTIGSCVSTTEIDSSDLLVDAMIIYMWKTKIELMSRSKIVEYLRTLKTNDCSIYYLK